MDFSSSHKSPFDCILFDLDDTLYPASTGIVRFMRKNIEDFLAIKCGISAEEASALRAEFFRTYGSSLIGLRARGYDVHPDEYHSFVHGRLPYEVIHPDRDLRDVLLSIPQTKILFTNSDREHARRALKRLGVDERIFARIVCFETMNPHLFCAAAAPPSSSSPSRGVVLKPAMEAFHTAIGIAGFDPHRTLFLDDNERNIAAAKTLGLLTALVGKRLKTREADYLVENISNLRKAIPHIWKVEPRDVPRRSDKETIMVVTTASVEA